MQQEVDVPCEPFQELMRVRIASLCVSWDRAIVRHVTLVLAIIAITVSIGAAIASFGLWRAARRANAISAHLAAIEADRRHDEQEPKFEITIVQRRTALEHADMEVKLVRPRRLDSVVVSILDEAAVDHWGAGLPGGISQTEADLFVWGAWEFNRLAAVQVASNRTSKPRRYSIDDGKNADLFDLVRTQPGRWMTGTTPESWQSQRNGLVRVRLECQLAGSEPWVVVKEVDVEAVSVAQVASPARRRIPRS